MFEDLAYFSSSCEALKPSGGTTALFGKWGQLVRREILASDQSHPTSGTLANSMQHTAFVPEDKRMVCVNSRNANGLFLHLHGQLQAQATLSLVEEGAGRQAQGDGPLST